jgi:uncharacterized membrane protein
MFTTQHIHPIIVHFPIVLILVGFLAEVIYLFFRKDPLFSLAGLWLFCGGTLAAVAAYTSGVFMTNEVYGAAGAVQSTHESFAEITVISSLVGSLLKIYLKAEGKETGLLNWIAFAIYAFTVIMVSITGYYGGVLVYDYMMRGGT